jgi:alkylation response protein AidB-like acyl-CoA dehydrogenase
MHFTFTEIQSEFRATLRRFLTERGGQSSKTEPRALAQTWRGPIWRELTELGATAALLPEDYDGLSGSSIDSIAILDELGRAQAPTPIIETAVLAASLIDRLGSPAQKHELLPAIAAGRLLCAVADAGILTPGATTPTFQPRAHHLTGRQDVVPEAPNADLLLVVAGDSLASLTLFALRPNHPGLTLHPFWTLDDRPAASLTLENAALTESARLGPPAAASAAITEALDLAAVAQCAEAAGLMASLLNQTIAHLKTRTQFGQPLAEFQALQHRLVDMHAAYELSLSLTYKAAILSKARPSDEQRAAVSAAKVQAAEAARLIGNESIQMHGAMGMSLELPVGRAVKRLRAMEPQYGSPAYHLARYRALRQARAS